VPRRKTEFRAGEFYHLLNSRLAFFFFQQTCAALEGAGEAYLRFFGQYLEHFPVRLSSASKSQRDHLAELVQHMLTLHRQLPKKPAPATSRRPSSVGSRRPTAASTATSTNSTA